MQKLKFVLFAWSVLLCLTACKSGSTKKSVPGGKAVIECTDGRSFDFGEVSPDVTKITHDYTIVNRGDGPLVIDKVDVSCDCLTVEFPDSPIEPEEEATIHLVLDAKHQPRGYIKRTCLVYNNSSNMPEMRFAIEGVLNDE
jgi:hypothetical protein